MALLLYLSVFWGRGSIQRCLGRYGCLFHPDLGSFRLGLCQNLFVRLGGELAFVKLGEQVRPAEHGALVALLLPPGGYLA